MRRPDKPAPTGGNAASSPGFAVAVALLLIWLLILGAPLNHDGRRQVLRSGRPGIDVGVAATRPGMADRGGPTVQCLTAGMPSLGGAPSGGACTGGTNSSHDRSNGYVHKPNKHQRKELCRYPCRDRASSPSEDLNSAHSHTDPAYRWQSPAPARSIPAPCRTRRTGTRAWVR